MVKCLLPWPGKERSESLVTYPSALCLFPLHPLRPCSGHLGSIAKKENVYFFSVSVSGRTAPQ